MNQILDPPDTIVGQLQRLNLNTVPTSPSLPQYRSNVTLNKTITSTVPAASGGSSIQDWSLRVPAGYTWRVKTIYYTVQATSGAGNRLAGVQVTNGPLVGNPPAAGTVAPQTSFVVYSSLVLTASLLGIYTFGFGLTNSLVTGSALVSTGFPDLVLDPNTGSNTIGSITALATGDQVSAGTIVVEETQIPT